MGRGRQKAKQTKVARRLKYFSPDTDYQALERELTSSKSAADDDEDDEFEDYEIPPATDEDDDDWSYGRR
ncbi:MAG: DUF3073 domain-containing protein [Actinomycetes bacterium]|nr:DUF3073 domain-containing protein [Actinomycetes bacterium]MDX5380810.1 DUF3073 domain-containing protein [Actinomycetes bacterium]MDX5399859.1 DUF3073 domain-containing protein [Actinomycetes bacterium]MDX5450555.1 DUF3073 domain-containing protein [Actinomycetes bacterium]